MSLSTFPSFASLWLLPRLPTFEKGQPAIDIRISAVDRMVDLDDPDHDLLLRQVRPGDAPPGAIRLFGEVCTPVIGASLAEAIARGLAPPLRKPQDLVDFTLIEMDDDRPSSDVLGWPHWLQQHDLPQLAPRRWISVNFTHQQVQTALAGQGVALARLPLIHDALARGDLIEPFGRQGRLASPWAYWQIGVSGARARPELDSFSQWLQEEARATRAAIGEG